MSTAPDSASAIPALWHPSEAVAVTAGDARIALLVERSRAGCHDSYAELVRRYHLRIHRFCLGWTGDPEDAEEVCQDTFVKAYSSLPRFREEGKFHAWLLRIAKNCCHDLHRSRHQRERSRQRPLDTVSGDALTCPAPSPDEQLCESEEIARIRRAIADLPEPLREVVVLCSLEGLSHQTCAKLLGCTPRAVEGRLYRARAELFERCGFRLP